MLTTPSALKGDPRVMCGLIASTSLRLIEKRLEPSSSHVFEATLLRLLEIYEYDAFDHGKRRAILARSSSRRTTLRRVPKGGSDVRDAIRGAHMAMFPKLSRTEFCRKIALDVRACFGEETPPVPVLARHKAELRKFLTLVRDGLSKQ
jgi:hypothetical protein